VACERRFVALGRLLGRHRITDPTIVTPDDIGSLVAACDRDVLPQRLLDFVRARLFPEDAVPASWADADTLTVNGQSLHYGIATDDSGKVTGIHFHPSLSNVPERLAAVTATAAAEHLIRSQKLADNVPGGTFEILPLFFGFGPLMSHAALHELPDSAHGLELTRTARVGTVSPLEFGYSMALADWSLNMGHEEVADLLRLDAKEGLQKGLRFLHKTSDCSFEADFLDRQADSTVGFVLSRLRSRSDSQQLNTLLDLHAETATVDPDLMEAVAELLRHRDPEIQRTAAATLGRCETLPRAIHDELVILTEDGTPALRRAAVSAIRPGYDNDENVVETLSEFLRRSDRALIAVSLRTLLKYESWPDGLSDAVLKALSTLVLASGSDDLKLGVQLLEKTHANPDQALQQHFTDDPTALAIFDELTAADES